MYNPNLYNPYNLQTAQPAFTRQQPINGLVFLNGGMAEAESYWMPPGSVSPPLFIDPGHFIVKTFDSSGGSSMELFEANKIPLSSLVDPHDVSATKADLDALEAKIMEAINVKHSVEKVPAASAATAATLPENDVFLRTGEQS